MPKTGTSPNNLFRAGSHEPIQIGNSFQTSDATASPQNSPLAYSTVIITIAVPVNAVELIVNPSTAMRISELPAMTTYDVIAALSKESIPVAGMNFVYIIRDSSNGTLNFRFTII